MPTLLRGYGHLLQGEATPSALAGRLEPREDVYTDDRAGSALLGQRSEAATAVGVSRQSLRRREEPLHIPLSTVRCD